MENQVLGGHTGKTIKKEAALDRKGVEKIKRLPERRVVMRSPKMRFLHDLKFMRRKNKSENESNYVRKRKQPPERRLF